MLSILHKLVDKKGFNLFTVGIHQKGHTYSYKPAALHAGLYRYV